MRLDCYWKIRPERRVTNHNWKPHGTFHTLDQADRERASKGLNHGLEEPSVR